MPCLRSNISRMLDRDDRRNGQTAQVADRARILPSDGPIYAVAALALCGRGSRGGSLDRDVGDREPKRPRARVVARAHEARLQGPARAAARDLGFELCRVPRLVPRGSTAPRWAPSPWAGSDRGSKKCTAWHAGPGITRRNARTPFPIARNVIATTAGAKASLQGNRVTRRARAVTRICLRIESKERGRSRSPAQ